MAKATRKSVWLSEKRVTRGGKMEKEKCFLDKEKEKEKEKRYLELEETRRQLLGESA